MFSLGDEVAWIHTYHIAGHPHTFWRTGVIEILRKDTVVVREGRSSHTVEVERDRLLIKNTVKPRRSGNSNWRKP
jgi:uncharacterized protein YbcV (DUF1398 family)